MVLKQFENVVVLFNMQINAEKLSYQHPKEYYEFFFQPAVELSLQMHVKFKDLDISECDNNERP